MESGTVKSDSRNERRTQAICPSESGTAPTNPALTDSQREMEIKRLGQQMEAAMNQATDAGSEYFAFRGEADRCRREMERLINSRPAEYVRKLEEERGLR